MKLMRYTLVGMLVSASVTAQDIKMVGYIDQAVKTYNNPSTLTATSAPVKQLRFLKIELSDKAHDIIQEKLKNQLTAETKATLTNTQLGMNNVPVLDQGGHGSCVTFANTAAIDASLNKGDYVSQLCLLQLGRYLENNGYVPSGWDGSLGPIVLNEITTFGLVSKTEQLAKGCGGLTHYSLTYTGNDNSKVSSPMSPVEYHLLSDPDSSLQVAWTAVLDGFQVFTDKIDPNQTLDNVKTAINAGDRLTFGVLLPGIELGVAGAVGHYQANYDTWVLTPEIMTEFNSGSEFKTEFAGHEMVITGYNDLAVATDAQGRTYNGLLTLRNSWGTSVGDKGDFYMTYDYFKTLTIEVQRIRSIA